MTINNVTPFDTETLSAPLTVCSDTFLGGTGTKRVGLGAVGVSSGVGVSSEGVNAVGDRVGRFEGVAQGLGVGRGVGFPVEA